MVSNCSGPTWTSRHKRTLVDRKLRWWAGRVGRALRLSNGWNDRASHLLNLAAESRDLLEPIARADLAEIEDITESVHELRAPYRAAVLIRHELIPNKPKKPAQQIYDDALDLLVDAFRRRRVPLLE